MAPVPVIVISQGASRRQEAPAWITHRVSGDGLCTSPRGSRPLSPRGLILLLQILASHIHPRGLKAKSHDWSLPCAPEPTCLLSRHPLRLYWLELGQMPSHPEPGPATTKGQTVINGPQLAGMPWEYLCLRPLHAEAGTADTDQNLRHLVPPI